MSEKPFYAKIVKCSHPGAWWEKFVGKSVWVFAVDHFGFWTRDTGPQGLTQWIYPSETIIETAMKDERTIEKNGPKFCRDCRWCACPETGYEWAKCRSQRLGEPKDMVSGAPRYPYCSDVRQSISQCSQTADWWEKASPPPF